jgi:hypothetical protein
MFFVKLTLCQRVLGHLVFVILLSFSIRNLKTPLSMVPPKLNYCSVPSISALMSKIYYCSPRWPPQCSCVVIESSFDPSERLQAPGSLWFFYTREFLTITVHVYIQLGWDHQTQFWKRTIQWLFYQSLVPIEQLVPDKKIFMWISHRFLC